MHVCERVRACVCVHVCVYVLFPQFKLTHASVCLSIDQKTREQNMIKHFGVFQLHCCHSSSGSLSWPLPRRYI